MKSIKELFKIGYGPSSSHTMGPAFAAQDFLKHHPNGTNFRSELYGSLSLTGKGHLTDYIIKQMIPSIEVIFTHKYLLSHPNTMIFYCEEDGVTKSTTYYSVGGGDIQIEGCKNLESAHVYPHNTFKEIKEYCVKENIRLYEYVERFEDDDIYEYMGQVFDAMMKSIENGLSKDGVLPGELKVKRKAKHLYSHFIEAEPNEIKESRLVSAYAYAVSEENASGGIIVTAPTCGSCGVLPSVVKYIKEKYGFGRKRMIRGMMTAALFGNVVKTNASISGAVHGCQAEIGTACSMAAAMHADVFKMSLTQIEYAAEIAMEHHLGLTCDPIKGYVQIPCIERNAVCAMRAIDASGLAYFLDESQKISFDMVVETMKNTGHDLKNEYKETSDGGLATLKLEEHNYE